MDGRTDGRTDGWTDGWTDGRTDGPTDAYVFSSSNHENTFLYLYEGVCPFVGLSVGPSVDLSVRPSRACKNCQKWVESAKMKL